MNYFYDLLPVEIQELIIKNVSVLLIQNSWFNFINNKINIYNDFTQNGKYPFINIFDINNVLNVEKASRIITGRTDNENKWNIILLDIYESLEYYELSYRRIMLNELDKSIHCSIHGSLDCSLYDRVDIAYSKLCKTFSIEN